MKITAILAVVSSALSADRINIDAWDRVVKKYVYPNKLWHGVNKHIVDYCAIEQDPDFILTIKSIENADLEGMGRDEYYATYLNIYNAMAVNFILKHPYAEDGSCITSIKNVTNAFYLNTSNVGGTVFALDDIEDHMRHPRKWGQDFDEYCTGHGAFVCTGTSCPNVRIEAYRTETVAEQMADNFRDWMSIPQTGSHLGSLNGLDLLFVTKVMWWFEPEFKACSGSANSSAAWLADYVPPQSSKYIADTLPGVELQYMDYNWLLNGPYDTCRDCAGR